MDYEHESKEIVSAIDRMVHGYDHVRLSLPRGCGLPQSIATTSEIYSNLFELSLKSRIINIYYRAGFDELHVELGESPDGGTNIDADVIETIARYHARYDGKGPNFIGERYRMDVLLRDYRKYLRQNRRIVLRDVSSDCLFGNRSFHNHDSLVEWRKSSELWRELHLGVGYGGGHEKFIDVGGHVQLAGKDCFVIQISSRALHDLVEDWRWDCLVSRKNLEYPIVDIWESEDYMDYLDNRAKRLFNNELGCP